ncbi:MAG TPA: radical SAM protein [Pyrinomonadaceae bacterium]|nr:radical SAM protein [Pyrinomonadaceae bacterium]
MKKMRAYSNILKLRLNMALKREVVLNYPVEAYLEPTSFCNLRCPACPTGLRLGERPSVSIDENLFKAAIDEIGDYVFLLWMYNWGEPLLHKQTPELIRYAKTKDLKVVLSSNLSIKLSDDYIERLVRSGLDTLIVGLDGVTEETYKKYRVNGQLDLVRDNMRRLQDAKARLGSATPHVLWQFLVFRHNEHEIDQVLTDYKQWGADSIKISPAEMPVEPHNQGFEPSTLPQYNMYHNDNAFMKEIENQMSSGRACSWLYGTFVMNPNGKVSPCCGVSAEQNDFGEYRAGGDFFKVWNNSKFRQARSLFTSFSKSRSDRGLSEEQKREISRRIDGMAMGTNHSLVGTELICHKCPIPFRQDDARGTILDVTYGLVHTLRHEQSILIKARSVFAYLLMGAPHWRMLGKMVMHKIYGSRDNSEAAARG